VTKPTIYHNPRCSKSRHTLELLQQKGMDPEVVEYLKSPPSAETLRELLSLLHMKPVDLIRRKEPEFIEQGLDRPGISDDEIIDIMVRHPRLIERPIVVNDGKAVIGRPPENVLTIL
jgi:arsenate reductase